MKFTHVREYDEDGNIVGDYYVPNQNIPATATAVTTEEQNNGSGNQSTVRNSWDYAAGLGRGIMGLPNLPGSDYSDKSNAFKYGYSVGNRAMPLALTFEGLKTPVSSATEFAVGYNGTLAQTVAVDAWESGYLGSTIINASTNNSNSGNNEAGTESGNTARMTTKQATAAANDLGYESTNYVTKSGEKVFYNKKTKTYISQDVGSGNGMGSHNGGVWKAAKSPEALNSKETRLGTYDADLNRVGD
jgi:hypothetical protein